MSTKENLCGECQRCCQSTLVRVTRQDIKRWKRNQRYDIILCLETWMGANTYIIHKQDKDECIFLTPEGCEIYATRPIICREFPKSSERAERFACRLTPRKHQLRATLK